jgi:hypothetical protein
MGPTLLLDKSALQSISAKGAPALFRHYTVVVPNILTKEILGDHAKEDASRQFGHLAKKLDTSDFESLVDYGALIWWELRGETIPMDGRPIVPGAKFPTPAGSAGVFHQSEREKMVAQWASGAVCDTHQEGAKQWRESLDTFNPEEFIRRCKDLPLKAKTLSDVLRIVTGWTRQRGNERVLKLLLQEFLPENEHASVVERWNSQNRPALREFLPYAAFCMDVRNFFSVALVNRLLPFCQVFCSGDNFHNQIAPIFLRANQLIIARDELRNDLAAIEQLWSPVSDSEKKEWISKNGHWPPENPLSVTFRCWKKHGVPREMSGDLLGKVPKEFQAYLLAQYKQIVGEWQAKSARGAQIPKTITIPLPFPIPGVEGVVVDLREIIEEQRQKKIDGTK